MHDPLSFFWAKSGRAGTSTAYHPLLCHMIDVAAVAEAMWREVLTPALRRGLARGLAIDEEAAARWLPYLAGLHDLGKATPVFQRKVSAAQAALEAAGLIFPSPVDDPGHGLSTTLALRLVLPEQQRVPQKVGHMLADAIGGHHGRFPQALAIRGVDNRAVQGGKSWAAARQGLVARLAELFEIENTAPPLAIDYGTAMTLAGLISVADWIGSDERCFPFAADRGAPVEIEHRRYFDRARTQALAALGRLCWLGWSPSSQPPAFTALFPGKDPRPVQRYVASLPVSARPGLAILELPMGEGKTEAAFYLADRWSVALGQRGSYVAMPTMATANQMFGRAHDFLRHRYPESVVNLQLLHGHAALELNRAALEPKPSVLQASEIHAEPEEPDLNLADAQSTEWFTQRKRGLLAPFGVGTVDQAFLAALQTRHVFVRHFGLAGKTVIFDEVHAYDVYMTTLFERLLEWLAALGSSVIILSATLPDARRRRLVEAYARGAGLEPVPETPTAQYPRVTTLIDGVAAASPVGVSTSAYKVVRLRWIDGVAEPEQLAQLGQELSAVLAEGGCAAVICNTVRRAQLVYQALKPFFPGTADDGEPELDLFHSRYLFSERQRRERRALRRFGKPDGVVDLGDGTSEPVRRPSRAVLVATQVIEQSLDLDFDLMVSELAPADLILQRSGRLHRHERPRRPPALREATLWLCRPELQEGVPRFDRGSEYVYHEHTLLRSWLALRDRQMLRSPDDVATLVEAVYDDRACPDELDGALRARWEASGESYRADEVKETREAEKRWLGAPTQGGALADLTRDARAEDEPELHREIQALTRLTDLSVGIVCLYGTEDHPTFDPRGSAPAAVRHAPGVDEARRLLMRAVSVNDRRVVYQLRDRAAPSGWQRSALLRNHRLVVLDAQEAHPVGRYQLRLDPELGLIVEDRKEVR